MRKGNNQVSTEKPKKKFGIFKICVILFMVYFVCTVCNQQIQINKYNSQIEMYEADIKNKSSLIDYYNNQKKSIESDEYIESVARESLGYVKPYEKIFVDTNK